MLDLIWETIFKTYNFMMPDNQKDIFRTFAFNETDCEIISGDGKKFKLHQFILEKNECFSAMLNSPMIEGQTKVLNLNENFEILEGIFVYLYSEEIFVSKEKDLFDLFVAANKYLMRNLECKLTENIIKRLNTNNAIQVLLIAEHSNPQLFESAVNYITENFEKIRNSNQWQSLTHELKDKLFDKYLEKINKREQLNKQTFRKYNIELPPSSSSNTSSSSTSLPIWSMSILILSFALIYYFRKS